MNYYFNYYLNPEAQVKVNKQYIEILQKTKLESRFRQISPSYTSRPGCVPPVILRLLPYCRDRKNKMYSSLRFNSSGGAVVIISTHHAEVSSIKTKLGVLQVLPGLLFGLTRLWLLLC